jgi:UDP-N-acetylglucosamine 2-epimerase
MKTVCVIGTRPEVIKTAPVVHERRRFRGRAEVEVCVTGQHRETLDLFDIRPDYDLDVMKDGQSLADLRTRSYLVLTDSRDIQKEGPTLGKPVLVLREITERPEGVATGSAKVIGTDRERIVEVLLRQKPGR